MPPSRDGQNQSLSELEAKAGELRGELRQREDQLQRLAAKLAEAEKAIEARALELDKMGRLYDEASLAASNRQIDLVVRETEVEKLAGDMQLLRGQRKDAERRMQEIAAENKAARDALKGERKKVTELEKKLERMVATLTDREEKLDRRERELARLREQLKGNSGSEDELNRKVDRSAGRQDQAGGGACRT